MKLTGRQIRRIQDALLDGYSSRDELRMMVRVELNENLDAIADGENLRVLVFNLLSWAEQTDQVDELVQGALNQNPGNAALAQLAQEAAAWFQPERERRAAAQEAGRPAPDRPALRTSVDVFLSYSRKDAAAMRVVQDILHDAGFAVWTDEGLEPGTPSWQEAIAEAIGQAGALVVLLSPNSHASQWVKNEVGFAQVRDKAVIPLLVGGDPGSVVPINLVNVQRVDGRADLAGAVERELIPALRQRLRGAPAAAAVTAQPAAAPRAEVTGTPVASPSPGAPLPAARRGRLIGGIVAVLLLVVGGALAARLLARGGGPRTAERATRAATLATQPGPAAVAPPATAATATEAAAVLPTPTPRPTSTLAPTATPEPARPRVRTNPVDGAEYLLAPGGEVRLGSNPQADPLAYEDEAPQRAVEMLPFWIQRTEVTNRQYRACVQAGECTPPSGGDWEDGALGEHPVAFVTWAQAARYAAWAGGRLPSEAEWERACRSNEDNLYPWGNDEPDDTRANFGSAARGAAPAGTFPAGATGAGLLDLAGNVWEWTSSAYAPYPYDPGDGREAPDKSGERVLRGGSFANPARYMRCANRGRDLPSHASERIGFRVAIDARQGEE